MIFLGFFFVQQGNNWINWLAIEVGVVNAMTDAGFLEVISVSHRNS